MRLAFVLGLFLTTLTWPVWGQSTASTEQDLEQAERAQELALDMKLVEYTRQLAEATYDLAWYTAALFVATVVLGVGTATLVWLAFKQGRDTSKSIAISQRAADAATSNATSLLVSSRAHIWMMRVTVRFEPRADSDLLRAVGAYYIFNGGSTPGIAKAVKIHLFRDRIEAWPSSPVYKDTISESAGIVGPNDQEKTEFVMRIDFTEGDVREFCAGVRPLIFFGYVVYSDVVDPTVEHRSGFAYRVLVSNAREESTVCSFQGPLAYWHYS